MDKGGVGWSWEGGGWERSEMLNKHRWGQILVQRCKYHRIVMFARGGKVTGSPQC